MYNRSDKNGKVVSTVSETLRNNLKRLASPEFKPFVRHLEEMLKDRTETLQTTIDTAVLYRMQGQCKVLKDILGEVASATKNS